MEGIIKRLLESKNSPQQLSTDIFNIKDRSDEAWDLYADIQDAVGEVVKGYDPNIDLDDSGLDSRGSTSGDRSIIYISKIFRFDEKKAKYVPITSKEQSMFKEELSKLISLPDSDEKYDYSTSIDISDMTLTITLRREEKWR